MPRSSPQTAQRAPPCCCGASSLNQLSSYLIIYLAPGGLLWKRSSMRASLASRRSISRRSPFCAARVRSPSGVTLESQNYAVLANARPAFRDAWPSSAFPSVLVGGSCCEMRDGLAGPGGTVPAVRRSSCRVHRAYEHTVTIWCRRGAVGPTVGTIFLFSARRGQGPLGPRQPEGVLGGTNSAA